MPYGLKYFAEFNTISSQNLTFRLEISKKNFTGDEQEITLTSTGCVQEWQEDNPFAPIKGCTLNIGIINDGTVSLDDFYSEADDEFYVELIRTDTMMTLFKGYILQDDSQEVVVDYAHEINIVATDNLGTLKDVLLLDAAAKFGTTTTYTGIDIAAEGQAFITDRPELSGLKPGQEFSVDLSLYVGNYTCIDIQFQNPVWIINVGQPLPNFGYQISDIIIKNPVEINDYVSLLTLVRLCLKSTNVDCGLKVGTKIYPDGGPIERWLDSTIVYGGTFLTDATSENCYDVLEKILHRFNASLFQTWGQWYIVRFGELFAGFNRTPKYAIEGYQYTNNFTYLGPFFDNHLFDINGNEVETGLLKSIIRPYKFVSEKFEYTEQRGLIKNTNLAQLGNLLNQFQNGLNTIYQYGADNYTINNFIYALIELTKNSKGIEISRYLTITYDYYSIPNAGYRAYAVHSDTVQLNAGTKVKISYDLRVNDSTISPGYAGNYPIVFVCNDGTNNYFLQNDLTFSTSVANIWEYTINPPGDLENWHSLNVEFLIPFDCTFYFYFRAFNEVPNVLTNQTYYRNIQFIAEGNYVENSKTIGHIHTETQNPNIKNVLEKTIGLDNAPANIIKGALFIDQINANGLQQLAGNWVLPCGEPVEKNITLSTTSTEEPFGFIYEGCQIFFNPGDEFTLSGFNEALDRTWVVSDAYNFNGINYVYVEGAEFGTGEGPFTGTITYNEPDKVFTSFGEFSVKEQLFNFQKPRYKYNGTLLFINRDERTISNLSLFYYNVLAYNNNNIMPVGSIAIDYRNEIANFTFWALFEQLQDPWCDFANFVNTRIYNFSYIYDIKQ